jgi:ABC-type antimicrobial peptide transport system permease subunit
VLRGLTYFWKINLAVLVAAAINTAVLAGALIVGDSVRGSLRDMTLDRLGATDHALVAERFFPDDLAERLAAGDWATRSGRAVAPAILLPGSAVNTDTGARASSVSVQGVDARFLELFPQTFDLARGDGQFFPSVVINQTLSRQLGVSPGEAMLLSFRTRDNVPDDTLLGNKENTAAFGTLRTVVVAVIADQGVGRFGLSPSQAFPANAFVSLAELQSALDQEDAANAMFVSLQDEEAPAAPVEDTDDEPTQALEAVLELEDLGLLTNWHDGRLLIESTEFVLRPATVEVIERAARAVGGSNVLVTSYLATELAVGERRVPYSTVAALAGAPEDLGSLRLVSGETAPLPTGNQILLNEWTADELGAGVGDPVRMEYYVVGPYEELEVESTEFSVAGVVALDGLGADRRLTPDYPGIESTDNIADWDPPFPVDLRSVRDQDEAYWDDYGATPKAFVGAAIAERLWSTRYGSVTSMRIAPPEGTAPAAFEEAFSAALHERVNLPQFGMRFLEVRADGLRASAGATDFSGLFIGFSFFLIASAAILVGLLFSLGIEARAGEIGLLLSVGYTVKAVRRRMLVEGGVVGAIGAVLGLFAAVGYASLMMAGLRTLWLPAVGTPMLTLHVTPISLVAGWFISVIVVLGSIAWTVRRLGKVPAISLLKGSVFRLTGASAGRRRLRRALAFGGVALALSMLAFAVVTGSSMDPMVFGTIGFPLLVAGLAAFADWCRAAHGRLGSPGSTALWAMAARNSAWSPGRSILSVALVAFAAFVIVTVAANHRDPTSETQSMSSGTGGFALVASAEIPLHEDLNSADDRFDLGFSAADEAVLAGARFIALRSLPGDDASCLNLYRPQSPQLLGVSEELVERGGFRFATELPPEDSGARAEGYDPANPWTLLYQDFGPGVVPVIGDANSVQWILHLGLGDDLIVNNEMGEPLSLRVVGTLAESVFRSELLMSEENLLANFPGQSGYSTFLVDLTGDAAATETDARRDAVSTAMERALGPYGFDAQRTDEKLAEFLVVQNTYLSTFQLLGGLGLLLGTVGLGVVLVRNVIERRGELATLRAFGFRRASLTYMVLAENAFLLVVGTAIGSAASLIAVAPRFVGGAFALPWGSLGLILAGVLAAGMLSSVAAVSGALRVPLLPALKGDR